MMAYYVLHLHDSTNKFSDQKVHHTFTDGWHIETSKLCVCGSFKVKESCSPTMVSVAVRRWLREGGRVGREVVPNTSDKPFVKKRKKINHNRLILVEKCRYM